MQLNLRLSLLYLLFRILCSLVEIYLSLSSGMAYKNNANILQLKNLQKVMRFQILAEIFGTENAAFEKGMYLN